MTFGELSQRLSRVDFLDGLGVYVGSHEVALAHVSKRFVQVTIHQVARTVIPGVEQPAERKQALVDAVGGFVREHKVDARRAYLSVPRGQAALSRVLLPVAAKENLGQVVEYELENLIPLPRDEVYVDFCSRPHGEERIEVLLMCIRKDIVQAYLDALAEALVHPRGIVLASTAIADYLAFCRGERSGPLGVLVGEAGTVEVAVLDDGKLVASQLVPPTRLLGDDQARTLVNQLAGVRGEDADVPLYGWELSNGSGPVLPPVGERGLLEMARGRLEAPESFYLGDHPGVLPAVGAALDAVREGTLPVNLLPAEERRGGDEGPSLATLVLVALAAVLLVLWGGSAVVKDEVLRRQVREQIAAVEPQVASAKAVQSEIEDLGRQLNVLDHNSEGRITRLIHELTEIAPNDAHLTSLNVRQGRVTIEGLARSASDLIKALEKSKTFKGINFASPTTKQGDKERFSIVAELGS